MNTWEILQSEKNLTYKLFSHVIKLFFTLNLATNDVDMILYFTHLSLNLLLISISQFSYFKLINMLFQLSALSEAMKSVVIPTLGLVYLMVRKVLLGIPVILLRGR